MKPSICKANNLDISLPEDCDLSDWLIPVGKIEEINTPSRNHAYITPDQDVYILAHNGKELTKISNHQLWEAIRQIIENKKQLQNDLLVLTKSLEETKHHLSDMHVNMSIDLATKANKLTKYTPGHLTFVGDDGQYKDSGIPVTFIENLERGLKIPVLLEKESDLPENVKVGDYFIIENMDITGMGASGMIWVSLVNEEIKINHFINKVPDSSKEIILYDSEAGFNGVHTFSDDLLQYGYLEIFYFVRVTLGGVVISRYGSLKVVPVFGREFIISETWEHTSGNGYLQTALWTIHTNSITATSSRTRIIYGPDAGITASDEVFIHRVVGYK